MEDLLQQKGDHRGFSDQDSLIASGRLDSVDMLNLVVFLENTCKIDFSDHFDQDELDSVDSIMTLVSAE